MENIKKTQGIDFSKVVVEDIDGIDTRDYPDFCDAYICGATIDGVEATPEELEEINENSQFVYDAVINWVF